MTHIFSGTAAAVALTIACGAASAQQLDVPIFEHESDGQAANCSAGTVMGLKADGDGFLSIRSGPGGNYRKLGELHNGDRITIFNGSGEWLGIAIPGGQIDQGNACQRVGPRRQLTGSGLGWVHSNWVGDIIP
ncbi:SH3 domain-containing protein [Paracoccus tegillarcae]|uniref:SH3 domain-containing protein n=1 Tax=Paracoccus tegillarcae TaxID=1529068 RepID=A0A2K9EE45_9RHOB|nr:SH3 domain-containing protein [Paracoccus tegillarcae]AUH33223.1 SH3 domain-containing protein [Paracoccus tegillarcae]